MITKSLTALLLTFLSFSAVAQAQPGNIQFGVNFSPEYSHRTPYFFLDRSKMGFTTGINSIYQLNNRIALETGLQYSNKGYQTTLMDLFFAGAAVASVFQATFQNFRTGFDDRIWVPEGSLAGYFRPDPLAIFGRIPLPPRPP